MEFIKKLDLMNNQYLEETRPLRYTKGLAPEEASHSAIADHKARDIFSLGVLIQEVLSGRTQPLGQVKLNRIFLTS